MVFGTIFALTALCHGRAVAAIILLYSLWLAFSGIIVGLAWNETGTQEKSRKFIHAFLILAIIVMVVGRLAGSIRKSNWTVLLAAASGAALAITVLAFLLGRFIARKRTQRNET
jgi:uncharacterized membrane protein